MKKLIIKTIVLIIVFIGTIFVAGEVLNQGQENITMEMAKASFPLLWFEQDGTPYNVLRARAVKADPRYEQEELTILGEERDVDFHLEVYDGNVSSLEFSVRNIDDGRLIEQTPLENFETEQTKTGKVLKGTIVLKDLIEPGVIYSLAIHVGMGEQKEVWFYTRVLWEEDTKFDEKLEFVRDFHERLFDAEKAKTLTKYLETNASKNDNSTFAYVNIYSSFKQLTYGDLNAKPYGMAEIRFTDHAGAQSSFLVNSVVTTGKGDNKVYYRVQEYFRLRYGTERIYLLSYERTMEQLPDLERMAVNDKLVYGIAGENIVMRESEDGDCLAFLNCGELYCYNAQSNKLAKLFGFLDGDYADLRLTYRGYDIKILDVDEGGNVDFAVYGYMSRGRHEGEIGIEIYHYGSSYNTIEEIVYIPYGKSREILQKEIDNLLYLNREQHLYLMLENRVFCVNLSDRSYTIAWTDEGMSENFNRDDTLRVSDDNRLIVANETVGDHLYENRLRITNLMTEKSIAIGADENEDIAVKFLGFIGDDIVYGLARETDITEDSSGGLFFPMYRIIICDETGKHLKNYEPEGYYVSECEILEDQITLSRVTIDDFGAHKEASPDYIATSIAKKIGRNTLAVASIQTYERYVQIQVPDEIDTKTLLRMTPKEVVFEGGREMKFEESDLESAERYYLYDGYGLEGIYNSPANAIRRANDLTGTVRTENGLELWKKRARSTRNQIMAITESAVTEDKNSLAVCLDSMLSFSGVIRNSDYLLEHGQTAMQILEENLTDEIVLNLKGCALDSVLYYVNKDIPVLVLMQHGDAVLITGYNESQIICLDPVKGTLERIPIATAEKQFAQAGNPFVTYIHRSAE